MPTYKLASYWLSMWTKNKQDPNWDLNSLSEESDNLSDDTLIDLFERFCNEYDLTNDDDYAEDGHVNKVFIFDRFESDDNVIEGLIRGGKYGTGAGHLDTSNDDWTRDARDISEAVIYPYYFLLALPETRSDQALLILEKIGRTSIRNAIENKLKQWVGEESGNEAYFDKFERAVTPDLIDQLENAARFTSLKLKKRKSAIAAHAQDDDEVFRDDHGSVKYEVHIGPESGESLRTRLEDSAISDVLFNRETTSITLDGEEFTEGNLTVQTESGPKKTFELFTDEAEMVRPIDTDDPNVHLDFQDHPRADSVSPIARELANELLSYHDGTNISGSSLL